MLNQVALMGNLATSPRQDLLPSGTAKTSFLIAVNEFYTDHSGEQQEKALFFWVEAFGRQAVNANSYLVQGQKVAISGSLAGGNIRMQDGSYKNCTVIRASSIEYLQKPANASANRDLQEDSVY
ncbi:MAG TPA: single-stranded DNA-binding protein [Oculatellaceae cyanobacterium]|jgi:single stranded DNA-binding protein